MIPNGIGYGGDINAVTARRVAEPQGTVGPTRVAEVAGHALPLYPAPLAMVGAPPWVASAAFFDAIGLAVGARSDFMERNGLSGPDAMNIVRTPAGRVATLAPLAAGRVVDIARKAGAITAELAHALKVALEVDGGA